MVREVLFIKLMIKNTKKLWDYFMFKDGKIWYFSFSKYGETNQRGKIAL